MQRGYKIFNSNGENRYGKKMEKGKSYSVLGNITFGNQGNGFHFCKNLSDVFRYYDTANEDFIVAKVIGSGNIVTYNDEYYGYYDMYACEKIQIVDFLERSEIIEKMLHDNDFAIKKFIMTFKMTEEEIALFKYKFQRDIEMIKLLEYYQERKIDVFEKIYKKDWNDYE